MAEATVGSIKYDLDLDDSRFKGKASAASGQAKTLGNHFRDSAVQLAALGAAATIALDRLTGMLGRAVAESVKQQSALTGLSSVARAFGQDVEAANQAAMDLTADGLMPLSDAATGLKNLMAARFSLPEAITLMNRFKDSAAFGRQGSLEFGQAVRTATEGIKNGNSILVDNAGVTKNLSVILEEAGYSAQDVMRATTDAGVRMALFNGIIKETKPQLGDAARLADMFAGEQAKLQTKTRLLNVALGTALQPILSKLFATISPIIEKVTKWITENPRLAAAIAIVTVAVLALVAGLGLIGATVGFIMNLAPLFAAIGGVLTGITLPAIAAVVAIVAVMIGVVMVLRSHWQTISNIFRSVVKPALDALTATVKNQLLPALKNLWAAISPLLIPVLKVIGAIVVGVVIAALWLFINVLKVVISWIASLANKAATGFRAIRSAISWGVDAAVWFKNQVVNAFNTVKGWIDRLIGFFKRIPSGIRGALGDVFGALTEPFKRAFDWIGGKADWVKSQLSKLNPFARHSPPLVNQVRDGTMRIAQSYGRMFDQIGAMAAQTRPKIMDAVNGFPAAGGTGSMAVTTGIYGDVNIYNGSDEDRLLRRISDNQERAMNGMATKQ